MRGGRQAHQIAGKLLDETRSLHLGKLETFPTGMGEQQNMPLNLIGKTHARE